MNRMNLLVVALVVAACVGSGLAPSSQVAEPAPATPEQATPEQATPEQTTLPEAVIAVVAHIEVDPGDTCDGCHAEMTPEVYQGWYAGKHGINNVKCFVCHGSVGEDFATVPSRDVCESCHFDQAESLAGSELADQSCFSCHPSHTLSPHLNLAQGGTP